MPVISFVWKINLKQQHLRLTKNKRYRETKNKKPFDYKHSECKNWELSGIGYYHCCYCKLQYFT